MCLMVVLIFISIDSCIRDLEMGPANLSNWSLPQGICAVFQAFCFSFPLFVGFAPVTQVCEGVNAWC